MRHRTSLCKETKLNISNLQPLNCLRITMVARNDYMHVKRNKKPVMIETHANTAQKLICVIPLRQNLALFSIATKASSRKLHTVMRIASKARNSKGLLSLGFSSLEANLSLTIGQVGVDTVYSESIFIRILRTCP